MQYIRLGFYQLKPGIGNNISLIGRGENVWIAHGGKKIIKSVFCEHIIHLFAQKVEAGQTMR
jgi:hypothetical protein